jgi:hypothetical protein
VLGFYIYDINTSELLNAGSSPKFRSNNAITYGTITFNNDQQRKGLIYGVIINSEINKITLQNKNFVTEAQIINTKNNLHIWYSIIDNLPI